MKSDHGQPWPNSVTFPTVNESVRKSPELVIPCGALQHLLGASSRVATHATTVLLTFEQPAIPHSVHCALDHAAASVYCTQAHYFAHTE